VLTREAGKNGELAARLAARGVAVLEMPLVASAPGPDRARLVELLAADADAYDWVCLTSPEAAAVFAEAWRAAGRPAVRVAVVGDGTARALAAAGPDAAAALAPAFTPSVANAEHFAPELPAAAAGAAATRVLYPSSAKASTELQAGLAARGFDVLRLNTYDTLPVEALDPGALAAARRAAVVAVASPSAVRAWVCFAGPEAAARVAVAAIGGTSARAARKLGLERVFFPEEPGIETFERAVLEALAAAAGA
jgi:uroporphyrinogen-III synthase